MIEAWMVWVLLGISLLMIVGGFVLGMGDMVLAGILGLPVVVLWYVAKEQN